MVIRMVIRMVGPATKEHHVHITRMGV